VIALLEENAHREVLTDFYEPAQICEPFIMACLPYPWSSVQHYHPALVGLLASDRQVPKVPALCLYPFNLHTDGSKYMVLGKPSLTAARSEETCFRRRFMKGLTKNDKSRPSLVPCWHRLLTASLPHPELVVSSVNMYRLSARR
jgi:hypothetical protein